MVIDFCLDPSNIINKTIPEDIRERQNILLVEGTNFRQNSEALLPTVVKKLIDLKQQIGQEKKAIPLDDPSYKDIEIKYDAIKTIVNSSYGVMGNRFFRVYDPRVASATTSLVRDLLHYVKDKIEEEGYKVIYVDTDSVFIASNEILTDKLNGLIKQWAKEKYSKDYISTDFSYEGYFSKLLILAKCRYLGYLETPKGTKEEMKGIEAKRKDSTEYMGKFQKTLIDKILNKEKKEDIILWIKQEIAYLPNQQLINVAFPCKLAKKPSDYKNRPIFVRAIEETNGFEAKVGDPFYYIYVIPEYYYEDKQVEEIYKLVPGKRSGTTKKQRVTKKELDAMSPEELEIALEKKEINIEEKIRSTKKQRDVKAFNKETQNTIENVDWKKMIERNITNKLDVLFNAMGWKMEEIL
jgi:DNA polymerase-2